MPFTSGVYAVLENSFHYTTRGRVLDPGDWNDSYADLETSINAISSGKVYASTTLASASTCDLGSSATTVVRVTGTTTITSFGTTPNCLRIVIFVGVLTLTHNATSLILDGGANLTTTAGESFIFLSDASGHWRAIGGLTGAQGPTGLTGATGSGTSVLYTRAKGGLSRRPHIPTGVTNSTVSTNRDIVVGATTGVVYWDIYPTAAELTAGNLFFEVPVIANTPSTATYQEFNGGGAVASAIASGSLGSAALASANQASKRANGSAAMASL